MKTGDLIPSISLKDQNGEVIDLSDFKGKKLIVFFYPKDFTPGCTKEACGFRDNYGELRQQGVEVIGISSDTVNSHDKFSRKHQLPYLLLSDSEKKARKAFGVRKHFLGLLPGRETFVFDENGQLIGKIADMNAKVHLKEALAILKTAQK